MSALQVDVARAQMQFRAALPHVHRFFAHLQDNRAAWAQVLGDVCRNPRKPSERRATADCLAPLALTYLDVVDNSADISSTIFQPWSSSKASGPWTITRSSAQEDSAACPLGLVE